MFKCYTLRPCYDNLEMYPKERIQWNGKSFVYKDDPCSLIKIAKNCKQGKYSIIEKVWGNYGNLPDRLSFKNKTQVH